MTWDEDPLCSSLVHQYLQARHPSLATEFSSTHNPPQCVFPLQDVLRKWEEIQLVRSLVQQHLEKVAPSLVQDFTPTFMRHQSNVTLQQVFSKFEGAQFERSLVLQHLESVTPALAVEFRQRYFCPQKPPKQLIIILKEAAKIHLVSFNGERQSQDSCQDEVKNKKLGANPKTFTEAEEARISEAIEKNESIGRIAKEMGRTYRSTLAKIWRRKQAITTMAKGRFSAQEDSRTRLAVENGEDYREVNVNKLLPQNLDVTVLSS